MKVIKNKYFTKFLFFSASFIMAYYFFKVVVPNADDYNSLITPYAEDNFGYSLVKGIGRYEIIAFSARIMYFFFGMKEITFPIWFAFWFFICCTCTLYIAVREFSWDKVYLVPVFMYIFIPYQNTNRYHFTATAISLLYLSILIFKRKKNKLKLTWKFILFTCILFVLAAVFVSDFVILGIFLIVPLSIYLLFYIAQNQEKRGNIYMVSIDSNMCIGVWRADIRYYI